MVIVNVFDGELGTAPFMQDFLVIHWITILCSYDQKLKNMSVRNSNNLF